MKTPLKILLWLVAALVALALAAVAAVALLFDPKDYQPLLERSVREATGRELKLEGELGLDLLPCCSVTLGRAVLGNPPGFPAGDFVSVEKAALGIRVWPLIARREVVVGAVRVEGLDARLLVRGDGRANWEFDEEGGAAEAAPTKGEGAGLKSLDIAGIRVTNGRIEYRDEQDASSYLVEHLELETGAVAAGEPFDVRLSARATEQAAKIVADLGLEATATVDAQTGRLTLAKPLLEVGASGAGLPAKGITAKLGAAELAVETAQDTKLAFRGLEGEFALPGLEAVAGDVTGSFVAEEARIEIGGSTELVVPKLTADVTASGAEIPGDTISAKIAASNVGVDVDKLLGSVESLDADVNGLGARLALKGGGRLSEAGAELRGSLKLDPVSPRSLLAVLREPEPKTADPEALTKLAGTADWALGKDALELTKMDVALDRSRITGRLGFAPLDEPVTRFDLRVDAIDLDRYMEPEVAAEAAPAGGGAGGAAEEDIPVETLRDLRLDGRVAVGQLVFDGLKLSDVTATVRAAGGKLRLDPLAAKLYGGEYRGSVAIDATGKTASVATEQSVAALQVGGFLKDLMQSDKLTGALTGRIVARGTGNTTDALMRSLDGTVAVSLADGAYLGTDFWHEIRTARARLKREAPPPVPAEPRTPLQAAELAGTITGGVLRTEKLLAQIPFIRLTAAGALDLAALKMDLRTQSQVFENPTFEDGTTLKDLKGLTIPVTLKGAMDDPDVSVDLKGLAASAATQKLLERLDKKLGGGQPPATESAPAPDGAASGAPAEGEPPKEEKPRDALKRSLRDLLKPRE